MHNPGGVYAFCEAAEDRLDAPPFDFDLALAAAACFLLPLLFLLDADAGTVPALSESPLSPPNRLRSIALTLAS